MRIPNLLLAILFGPFVTLFFIRLLSTFGGAEATQLNQGQIVLLTIFTLIGVGASWIISSEGGHSWGSIYVKLPDSITRYFKETNE